MGSFANSNIPDVTRSRRWTPYRRSRYANDGDVDDVDGEEEDRCCRSLRRDMIPSSPVDGSSWWGTPCGLFTARSLSFSKIIGISMSSSSLWW